MNAMTSAEILDSVRKIEEQHQRDEMRKQKERALNAYFEKEGSRRSEMIKCITTDDVRTHNERCEGNMVKDRRNNESFYCVHMLLRYKENMQTESYVAPSPRGCPTFQNERISSGVSVSPNEI